jgi:hypothetical protein
MTASALTPLESAVLGRFRREHCYLPAPDRLVASGRENTGAGRFTHIPAAANGIFLIAPNDPRKVHTLAASIEMDGVEAPGLGAVLFVEAAELTLELHTYVGGWDGVERAWKFDGDA